MTTLTLIVALCTFQLACCLGFVWFMFRGQRTRDIIQQESLATELVKRLQAIATGVAVDVGRHDTSIKQSNFELEGLSRREAAPLQGEVLDVVDKIISANRRVRERLAEAEQALAEQADLIDRHAAEARTDALTSLANRRAFDGELSRCLEAWTTHEDEFCLLLLDLDHFKSINDRHGHTVGDESLKAVAQALRAGLRGGQGAFRFGGEEFAVILPGVKLKEARPICQRLLEGIARAAVNVGGANVSVTASLGLAQALLGESAETLLSRTDKALYAAKHAGRDAGFVDDGVECVRFTPLRARHLSGSKGGLSQPTEEAAANGDGSPANQAIPQASPVLAAPLLDEICDAYERGMAAPTPQASI